MVEEEQKVNAKRTDVTKNIFDIMVISQSSCGEMMIQDADVSMFSYII
jgi:hypothetical protein